MAKETPEPAQPKKERKQRASNWLGEVTKFEAEPDKIHITLLQKVDSQADAKRVVEDKGRENIEYRYVKVFDEVIVKEAPKVPIITTRTRDVPLG